MSSGDDLRTGLSVAWQCGFIAPNDEVIHISSRTDSTGESSSLNQLLKVEILPNPTTALRLLKPHSPPDTAGRGSALRHLLQSVVVCGRSRDAVKRKDDERHILHYAEEGTSDILEEDQQVEVPNRQHIVMTGETWNLILTQVPELVSTVSHNCLVLLNIETIIYSCNLFNTSS